MVLAFVGNIIHHLLVQYRIIQLLQSLCCQRSCPLGGLDGTQSIDQGSVAYGVGKHF